VDLTSNTTRLPNMAPYNTFFFACTATVPQGVVSPKTFTWSRRIGASMSGLIDITDNGSDVERSVVLSCLKGNFIHGVILFEWVVLFKK